LREEEDTDTDYIKLYYKIDKSFLMQKISGFMIFKRILGLAFLLSIFNYSGEYKEEQTKELNYSNKLIENNYLNKVNNLSNKQNYIVNLMSESLKDSSFRNKIGNIIKEDVYDKYAEHGGIVILSNNKINLKTLESTLKRDTSNNNLYGQRDKKLLPENIAEFHLHSASYNEEKYSIPGPDDLTISYFTNDLYGESHEFVITSLRKGKFNIDYYGGDKTKNKEITTIDMGNYNYDTTSTKNL